MIVEAKNRIRVRLDFLLGKSDFLLDAQTELALAFEQSTRELLTVRLAYLEYGAAWWKPQSLVGFADYLYYVA